MQYNGKRVCVSLLEPIDDLMEIKSMPGTLQHQSLVFKVAATKVAIEAFEPLVKLIDKGIKKLKP